MPLDTAVVTSFGAFADALGRAGVADDIGPMIAALLSDDNRWVNGQRIEAARGRRRDAEQHEARTAECDRIRRTHVEEKQREHGADVPEHRLGERRGVRAAQLERRREAPFDRDVLGELSAGPSLLARPLLTNGANCWNFSTAEISAR